MSINDEIQTRTIENYSIKIIEERSLNLGKKVVMREIFLIPNKTGQGLLCIIL